MYLYRLLFLTLVLSTLSYAFYSKGDISVTSLKGLIKAIFLFKGVKNVFLIINRIKRLRLSIIRFFRVKIFENHTSRIFLRRKGGGRTLVLPHSGGCAVLVRHLVLHRYFDYYRSYKCY